MSRLAITFEMSDWIEDRIQALAVEDPEVAEAGALPLYHDKGGVLAIRPDGTLLEWSGESGGTDARPIEDRRWLLLALVAGARRYPKFRALLPAGGPGGVDCDCRRIPATVSGVFGCSRCGGLGWLDEEGPRFVPAPLRMRQPMPMFGLVFVALAVVSFWGALGILFRIWKAPIWHSFLLIGLGILCLRLAPRGIGRRPPSARPATQGPTFDLDDPEIAELPATSTTHLGEQVRRARERRKRAGEW